MTPRCTDYCLLSQYLAFVGLRYGKNVRDFLEALVRRQLARGLVSAQAWARLYLHTKSLYPALAQRDKLHRQQVSPAIIARQLMQLD